jgi:hypothetical protein
MLGPLESVRPHHASAKPCDVSEGNVDLVVRRCAPAQAACVDRHCANGGANANMRFHGAGALERGDNSLAHSQIVDHHSSQIVLTMREQATVVCTEFIVLCEEVFLRRSKLDGGAEDYALAGESIWLRDLPVNTVVKAEVIPVKEARITLIALKTMDRLASLVGAIGAVVQEVISNQVVVHAINRVVG